MGLIKEYLGVVKEQTGMRGVYPPQMSINLGDYGPVRDGRFVPTGNLNQIGIQFNATKSPGSMSREFKSKGVSKVLIGAGASVNGQAASAKARMELDFASEFSVYCAVSGCKHNRMTDVARVGDAILGKYHSKEWREEWAAVTETMSSSNTTIVVAREKKSKMVLEAAGSVPAINMADPSIELSVVFDSTSSEQWITERNSVGLTPFCFLMKVDDPLFGGPEFEPFSLIVKKGTGAKVAPNGAAHFVPFESSTDLGEWRSATEPVSRENRSTGRRR